MNCRRPGSSPLAGGGGGGCGCAPIRASRLARRLGPAFVADRDGEETGGGGGLAEKLSKMLVGADSATGSGLRGGTGSAPDEKRGGVD
jgi:hypothetical protein